ncbi:MAG: hypothetical protein ACK502_09285 [Alphaproteobacteria bacterium]
MFGATLILWLGLLGVFSWCAYWHVQENKKLSEHWKQTLDENQSLWLSRFAWSRSIQLLLALACGTLIIVFYSIKLDSAQEKIRELSIRKPIANNQPLSVATPSTQKPAYYPPASTTQAAQTAPQVVAPATAPVQPAAPNVQDIYTPSSTEGDSQSTMDSLKQRYEDMLVIHFFLDRCGKIDKNDYYIIMAALSQDMASVNAPGRMQHDVLTAAQGSYNEMYAKSPCDSVDLSALISQYKAYIEALSQYTKR